MLGREHRSGTSISAGEHGSSDFLWLGLARKVFPEVSTFMLIMTTLLSKLCVTPLLLPPHRIMHHALTRLFKTHANSLLALASKLFVHVDITVHGPGCRGPTSCFATKSRVAKVNVGLRHHSALTVPLLSCNDGCGSNNNVRPDAMRLDINRIRKTLLHRTPRCRCLSQQGAGLQVQSPEIPASLSRRRHPSHRRHDSLWTRSR
ncbi:hypothetical protein BDZ97DRAFT_142048 [Flammula alnicola]|nr:hypothetical protein BDZ97DRAFT_142048 [Flammula alnicola]